MDIYMPENNLSGEVFYPSKEIVKKAHSKNYIEMVKFASDDLEGFWAKEAKNLHWFKKWDKVLDDSQKPFYKWFVGGKTNIAYNCLDVHVKTARRNKLAFIWEGENGDFKALSYF